MKSRIQKEASDVPAGSRKVNSKIRMALNQKKYFCVEILFTIMWLTAYSFVPFMHKNSR
jgi:hypothetical protein